MPTGLWAGCSMTWQNTSEATRVSWGHGSLKNLRHTLILYAGAIKGQQIVIFGNMFVSTKLHVLGQSAEISNTGATK